MKLATVRQQKGFTQKSLSEKSGVNYRTLQKYETGEKDINKASALTVLKLADTLGVDIREILEIDNESDIG